MKKAAKKRIGRPPKPKEDRRVESIRIALTTTERDQLESAANIADVSISEAGRVAILEWIGRQNKKRRAK